MRRSTTARHGRLGWRCLCTFLPVALLSVEAAGQRIIWSSSSVSRRDSHVKVKEAEPSNAGLAKMVCASPYGGKGNDKLVAVRILPDRSILLAGNMNMEDAYSGGGEGFLVRLTVQDDQRVTMGNRVALPGTLNRVKTDAKGNIYLLLDNAAVYHIVPGAREPSKHCVREGIIDFGVCAGGELVILHKKEITRYDATWQTEQWTAAPHAYGTNYPRCLDVCPECGVTTVIGYGLAHLGRSRWRGAYAHGIGPDGKTAWTLWDQKPTKQLSKKDGGNDLTADVTGTVARCGRGGQVYLSLYSVNEKNVCTRDPKDSDKKIDKDVFGGTYQDNPGRGFRGSSRRTSVAFRADGETGTLHKGTWMCAWLNEGKSASSLTMTDLTADADGRVYVVGGSEFGCPTKDPWYFQEGGYQGDGFLAVYDNAFQMLQCGYFVQTVVYSVDAAHGYVVIGGAVKYSTENKDLPLRVCRPVQKELAGGLTDGFFAVFATGAHGTPGALPSAAPAPQPTRTEAAELLAEARAALSAGNRDAARAKVEALLAEHSSGAEADQARALLRKLSASATTPAPKPASPADAEKQANKLLQKAENYLANRMKPLAKKALKELVAKYPETFSGKEGQRLLDKHFLDE